MPLLSIVIATKNREYYCIEAIKSILSIKSEEIQLGIADNSDSGKVKEFVDSLDDTRIVYKYDNSPTSSIENFNRCMSLATGEYVCMIGDDDSVLPNILNVVKWAKENDIDSISCNSLTQYYWPKAYEGFDDGLLIFPTLKSRKTAVNSKKTLKKLVKNGIVNHYEYSIPRTYHGLVKRDLMIEIKTKTGSFYGGLSPDIYSSFALSSIVKNHYEISLPFTIAGVCAKSSTAENLIGKHSGELKDMPHLKNKPDYIWDEKIPKYYGVYTTWCESALKALSDMKEKELYEKFNVYPLLAIGILTNWKYILKLTISKTEQIRKKNNIFFILFWLKIFYNMFVQIRIRIFREINNKFYLKKTTVPHVTDIQKAIEIVSNNSQYLL